jgi:hypothetical protein
MRILVAMVVVAAALTNATAQSNQSKPTTSAQRSGTTYLPSHQQHEEVQPQSPTGPLDTMSGGAPPESPQGETPPGMQAAPEGSSKSILDKK